MVHLLRSIFRIIANLYVTVVKRKMDEKKSHIRHCLLYEFQLGNKAAEAHLGDGGETSIKATVMKQGVQNGLEKYQGILQGMQKNPDLLTQKDALDRKAKEWAAQPGHEAYKQGILLVRR